MRNRHSKGRGSTLLKGFAAVLLGTTALFGGAPVVASAPAELRAIHLSSAEDGAAQIVFDLSAPVEHDAAMLDAPDRVFIDLGGAIPADDLNPPALPQMGITRMHQKLSESGRLRIAFDLTRRFRVTSRLMAPQPGPAKGWRLVLDLQPERPECGSLLRASQAHPRDRLVAIDAGHGGGDPGAIGALGYREKDVALALARELAAIVNHSPGTRALLIRDADRFLRQRARFAAADAAQADVFISLHADAVPGAVTSSPRLFMRSERGASGQEARQLAERENAADLIGSESPSGWLRGDPLSHGDVVAEWLIAKRSTELARILARALGRMEAGPPLRVETARFAVLDSPNTPSVLLEVGSPLEMRDEHRLATHTYRRRLAEAIWDGIADYLQCERRPGQPPETRPQEPGA